MGLWNLGRESAEEKDLSGMRNCAEPRDDEKERIGVTRGKQWASGSHIDPKHFGDQTSQIFLTEASEEEMLLQHGLCKCIQTNRTYSIHTHMYIIGN